MTPSMTIQQPRTAFTTEGPRERRGTGRIRTPVLVRIRKVGAGHASDVTSVIDNLGAGGFYVRLMQRLEPGARLVGFIKFVNGCGEAKEAARVAVRGNVLRVDELPGGVYGVAVKIRQYKFV